jgi:signal transduction histidine kinase/CheY-like chemotaxis protein
MNPTLSPGSGALQVGLLIAAALLAVVLVVRWRIARDAKPSHHVLAWLQSAVFLSIVLPLVLLAAVLAYTHLLATDQNRAAVERLARTSREHALKVFETSEVLMGRAEDLVAGLSPAQIRQRSQPLHAAFQGMVAGLAHVHALWVVDDQGRVLASSRFPQPALDLAGRDSFEQHRKRADRLLVSPPRTGVPSGTLYFEVSRKRAGADGAFAGLVVVALSTNYFRDFYREVSPRDSGVAHTLLTPGGAVLSRWPANLAPGDVLAANSPVRLAMAAREPAGTVHSLSTVDGRARVAAYRQVGGYPVYVHAGIDEDTGMAAWRGDALVLAAFVLPLAAVLALATLAALRRTRQNIAMAERLEQEYIERGKVEAALHHSQKLEALGHISGGVAHDFNNLLMVVSMNAAILSRQAGAGAVPRPLQAIHSAVKAGTKLTRQLVAFTRRQPLLPQPIDFAQRLESDLELLRTLLGSRIRVEGEVVPGTAPVLLDESELELALINLAINAKHAMPAGGTVRLDVRPAAHGVALTFSDTGSGIAKADLERVFEPFFTTKPVGIGTGLGLSQVQGLCARAGGRVEIESTVGEGTSVRLLFPALAAQDAPAPAKAAAESALQVLDAEILLVEDHPEVASATIALLRSLGCRTIHCEEAADALALLERGGNVDAVLSDIVMPGALDGIAFARVLRERRPGLPVLLMTGYAERIDEAEALGITVVPKPVDAALLAARLRQMLRRAPAGEAAPLA